MKTRYAFLYFNICEYKVLETYLRQMAKKRLGIRFHIWLYFYLH